MKNLNYIIKKNRIIKYLFLISGIFILFLILFCSSDEEQKILISELDPRTVNQIPKEFNLNMNNSIFEGINKDKLPYQIKANIVTKQNSNIYNLKAIIAKYNLSNGDLQILAKSGILNEGTKIFILYKDVKVVSDGLVLYSDKINFNLNSNIAYSDYPVEVNFKNSTIKASSFTTEDSSNIINFEGNVVSTFNLNDF